MSDEPRHNAPILVVGVGSPHGDDQAGWRVAEALQRECIEGVNIRFARSPSDLLDWMEGVSNLVVIDACRGPSDVGSIHRWAWPAPEIARLTWSGTHDLGLPTVLELAERLGKLPKEVTIWSIHAGAAEAYSPLSEDVAAVVDEAATQICDRCFSDRRVFIGDTSPDQNINPHTQTR